MVGAGALGCTIAAAGSDVTLIGHRAAHVEIIDGEGLHLHDGDGTERLVPIKAVTDCSGLISADLLIVLVKAMQTREAIRSAGPVIGNNTTVMSCRTASGTRRS